MRRGPRIAALAAMVLVALHSPVRADNFDFVFGYRSLDTEVWAPATDHQLLGFDYDRAMPRWPVHLTVGLHISSERKDDQEGFLRHEMNVAELSFGIKKFWKVGRSARPYLGGGASWIWNSHFEIAPIRPGYHTNDSTVGIYAQAGVLWRVGPRFNAGFDVRLLRGGDLTFTQRQGRLRYEQIGFTVGFNWGRDRDR